MSTSQDLIAHAAWTGQRDIMRQGEPEKLVLWLLENPSPMRNKLWYDQMSDDDRLTAAIYDAFNLLGRGRRVRVHTRPGKETRTFEGAVVGVGFIAARNLAGGAVTLEVAGSLRTIPAAEVLDLEGVE